jgi:hypothetical protein
MSVGGQFMVKQLGSREAGKLGSSKMEDILIRSCGTLAER